MYVFSQISPHQQGCGSGWRCDPDLTPRDQQIFCSGSDLSARSGSDLGLNLESGSATHGFPGHRAVIIQLSGLILLLATTQTVTDGRKEGMGDGVVLREAVHNYLLFFE